MKSLWSKLLLGQLYTDNTDMDDANDNGTHPDKAWLHRLITKWPKKWVILIYKIFLRSFHHFVTKLSHLQFQQLLPSNSYQMQSNYPYMHPKTGLILLNNYNNVPSPSEASQLPLPNNLEWSYKLLHTFVYSICRKHRCPCKIKITLK